jgi:hypothetical protein
MRLPPPHWLLATGILATAGSAYYSRSASVPTIAPEDAALQRRAEALAGATPDIIARLESRLAAARARLPPAPGFDAWLQGACRSWMVATRSTGSAGDLELRQYGLVYDHPRMNSWPDITASLQALCAEPGLTIDRLEIAAAPDGADAFQQVEIRLTVLLRP